MLCRCKVTAENEQLHPHTSEWQFVAQINTSQEIMLLLSRDYYANHASVLQTLRTGMHIQRLLADIPGLFGVGTVNALHAHNE